MCSRSSHADEVHPIAPDSNMHPTRSTKGSFLVPPVSQICGHIVGFDQIVLQNIGQIFD